MTWTQTMRWCLAVAGAGTLAAAIGAATWPGAVQLPATGQTTTYAVGDDGALQAGVPAPSPRFTDHGNGTVTDHFTGLMWTRDASLAGGPQSWNAVLLAVMAMNAGSGTLGHTDWRAPNIYELRSLVDFGAANPALPAGHPFANVSLTTQYWSSTSVRPWWSPSPLDALAVSFADGGNWSLAKGLYRLVWACRTAGTGTIQLPRTGWTVSYGPGDDGTLQNGVTWPTPRLTDNGDGTVSDHLTGLMWTKNAHPAGANLTWPGALGFVAAMNVGSGTHGYTDWRMANANELASLTDYARRQPALPAGHPFVNLQPNSAYWTSTTPAAYSTVAITVGFNSPTGPGIAYLKTAAWPVWPVRDDRPQVIEVDIDIKPGSDKNPVNLKSKGKLPVAILTSDDFDALSVDEDTVSLGSTPPCKAAEEDVDGDGDTDLVLHFSMRDLVADGSLDAISDTLVLTGMTDDGASIEGSDVVTIVPR